MGSFQEEYRRLNAAQRQAVDAIEGPVLVIAGPGTGKTQLLSLRVANILQKTDVNPYNILCLTYTESGQSAMRERLGQLLGRSAKKVQVHTFHGFGNYLIGRFSEHFGELTNFRPADDLALYEVMRTCFEHLLRSNALAKQAYGQFTYQADAATRISQLKQAGITPVQASAQVTADAAWCQSVGKELTKIFNQLGRLSAKSAASLEHQLADILGDQTEAPELGRSCLDELRSALDNALSSGKTASLSAFKRHWFTSEDSQLYFKPKDQLKKLEALSELYELYERELQKRKLYDYDDMILYALQKLSHNKTLLAEVQENFQYILADEYQDTNAAQAQIITLIASNRVNENRPNVMVVGDDDQAIYGFQGALGDVMLHFREKWRDVTVVTLKDNYRSSQPILNTARSVIQTGQNRLENYYEDIDKSLSSRVAYPAREPVMFATPSPIAVLAKVVTDARLAKRGEQLAIIAPKHRYLQAVADRLDTAGIDYYYEGREDILKDQRLQVILMYADLALAVTKDELYRSSYLLPELVTLDNLGLNRAHAWSIAVTAKQHHQNWWEVLAKSQNEHLKAAYQALQAFIKLVDPSDAIGSLETIAKQKRWHRQRFIKALYNHAATYLGREDLTLADVLYYVRLCRQAGINLSHKVVKGDEGAPVVLLSAHKSKGLEFDRVYVLHADAYTWFKERGRTNTIGLPPGWQAIEPPQQTLDDRLRLLYVVMTRAKRELVLIKSQISRTGKPNEDIIGLEDVQSIDHQGPAVPETELPPQTTWQRWYLPTSEAERQHLRQLIQPLLDQYHLSPSHLTTFLNIAHGGPAQFVVHNLLGIPEAAHPEALFGSAVHQALRFAQEQLNKKSKLPTANQFQTFLRKTMPNISRESRADIIATVMQFLDHSQILVRGGQAEYSFLSQTVRYGDLKLTGTVDHFYQTGEKLAVTDFKTGRALNSWRVTEDYYRQKLHRFRQQLLFYQLLFQQSAEFSSVKTFELQVAFVEPSRRDVYCQLTLPPSADEELELKALMVVVWHCIMQLRFPDVDHYGTDFASLQAFEEDIRRDTV